jgi:putative Mn2+ efflux pump MntP
LEGIVMGKFGLVLMLIGWIMIGLPNFIKLGEATLPLMIGGLILSGIGIILQYKHSKNVRKEK